MQNLMDDEIEEEYWQSAMGLAHKVEREESLIHLGAPKIVIEGARQLVGKAVLRFSVARQKYEAMVEPDSLESTNIDKE